MTWFLLSIMVYTSDGSSAVVTNRAHTEWSCRESAKELNAMGNDYQSFKVRYFCVPGLPDAEAV